MTPAHEDANELYRTWWKVVETSFGLLSPSGPPPPQPEEDKAPDGLSDSLKPIGDALNLTRRLLTSLYGALIPSLGAAPAGQDWQSLAQANAARLKVNLDKSIAVQKQLLESGLRAYGNAARALTSPSLVLGGLGSGKDHPYLEGLDRTFSALTDAFGLGPSKALRDAFRELIVAEEQRRAAQLEYFAVLGATWGQVIEGVAARLSEMAARGEQVDSILGWVRLWASVADKAVHAAMQSEAGLKATSDYIRAALRYRQQRNRVVEILSEAVNAPTRAELDDAYLEIQKLKRQMRQLRRSRVEPPPRRRAATRKAQEKSIGKNR